MTVSDQIIAVINELCEKLGFTIDWSAKNVLPKIEALCAKYIRYEIATSIFWMVLFVAITGLCWLVAGILWRQELKRDKFDRWEADDGHSIATVLMIVFAVLFSIMTVIVAGIQIYDIIEAKIFPEKTIYDFVIYNISQLKN